MELLFSLDISRIASSDGLNLASAVSDPEDRLLVYSSFVRECISVLLNPAINGLVESSAISPNGYATTYSRGTTSLIIHRVNSKITIERTPSFSITEGLSSKLNLLEKALKALSTGDFQFTASLPSTSDSLWLKFPSNRGTLVICSKERWVALLSS